MAGADRRRIFRLPRRTDQWRGDCCISLPRRHPLAPATMPAQPEGTTGMDADGEAGGRVPSQAAYPAPLAQCAFCRQTPEVGAECPNWARSDLCGGRPAMSVPTANAERPRWGGPRSFAGACADAEVAPIPAIYATRRGLAGSTHSRSSCVADPRYELDDYLRRPEEQRRQARPPIDVGILRWSKPDLEKLFDGYCACCEAPFQDYGFGQINHYRPKGGGGGHMRSERLGVRI